MTHVELRKRRKQIAEAVRRGEPVEKAAQSYGVALQTAALACREYNVPLPVRPIHRARDTMPRGLKIVGLMRHHHLRDAQIARKFRITRQRVEQIRRLAEKEGLL